MVKSRKPNPLTFLAQAAALPGNCCPAPPREAAEATGKGRPALPDGAPAALSELLSSASAGIAPAGRSGRPIALPPSRKAATPLLCALAVPLLALALALAPPQNALAAAAGRRPVEHVVDFAAGVSGAPAATAAPSAPGASGASRLELIGAVTATYNTDYWHYSGGYWRDGDMSESAIYDYEQKFWNNPEAFPSHDSLRIKAKAALPQAVREHLAAGGEIELSVRPSAPDTVNPEYAIEYDISGDELSIFAMPKFHVEPDISYRTYVPELPDLVPIVADGYGCNMYSMFRGGAGLGVLASSMRPDPGRVEFADILDSAGRLAPGKRFDIRNPDSGVTTPANSGEITIGSGPFGLAGAIGMWFAFEFDVAIYGALPAAPEPPEDGPGGATADFAVTGFRQSPAAAQASTVAKAFVKVKNAGDRPRGGVLLRFSDGASAWEKSVDFGANEEKEIEFEWIAQDRPGDMALWAHINPERSAEETDYSNNRMEYAARVDYPPTDLSVVSLTPSGYAAGRSAVTLVEVRNDGNRAFGSAFDGSGAEGGGSGGGMGGSGGVTVSFSIPSLGISETQSVYIDENAAIYVPFVWNAPLRESAVAITASVNMDRSIGESDYSNNSLNVSAGITRVANPPFGTGAARREWTESRFSHYQTITRTVNGRPYTINRAVYTDKAFYAETSLSASLLPGSMKSGYGAECEVVARLTTNYDMPGYVIGLQSVQAYLPTTGYAEAIELEPVPGAANRWRFPVNPASIGGNRVQYVPIDWPDGTAFEIGFTGRGGQCPGGALAASAYAGVLIDGNMFEDDITSQN